MGPKPRLSSVGMNDDLIEEKLSNLLDGLPDSVPDKIRFMIHGLSDNIVVVQNTAAFPTNSPFDITLVLDFDAAAYNKVMAAVLAFKADKTH